MESGREVGRWPFCCLGAGEGNLHHVEVADGPRHGEVHGVELGDEALQLIDRYTPLDIGYLQKGDYLEALLGIQGKVTTMGADRPYRYFLDSYAVPAPGQLLLQASRVLRLTQKGGEDLLEGADGELGYPLLLSGVSLGITKEVVYIYVYLLETVAPLVKVESGSRA